MVDWSEHALPVDSIAYVSSMDTPSSARMGYMMAGLVVDILVLAAYVIVFFTP